MQEKFGLNSPAPLDRSRPKGKTCTHRFVFKVSSMARIGIAGGGIIGCATAIHLIERGHEVTVFEKDIAGLPASVGNAGILAIPEIEPLARADMLLSAPKWLADPLGPLTLRWQDLPALTPWLLNFTRAALPARVARSRNGSSRTDARCAGRARGACPHDGPCGPHETDRRPDHLRQRAGGRSRIRKRKGERRAVSAITWKSSTGTRPAPAFRQSRAILPAAFFQAATRPSPIL